MKENIFFIVDDDEEDTELLIEALRSLDSSCKCFVAANGEQALEKLAQEAIPVPHYIFLDLNMPRLNGKQFLAEIKKLEKFRHIPVIIYSTSSAAKDEEETKQLGAKYFLTKPDSFQGICNSLGFIFKSSNATL